MFKNIGSAISTKTAAIAVVVVLFAGTVSLPIFSVAHADDYSGGSNDYSGDSNDYSGGSNDYGGYTNDYSGGSNDYSGGSNDYGGYTNDYSGGSNDYGGYTNDYGGYTNDYGGYTNDYGEYGNDYNSYASGYDENYDTVDSPTWTETCYSEGSCTDSSGTTYTNQNGVLYSNSNTANTGSTGSSVASAPRITSAPTSYSSGGITVTAPQYRTTPTYVYSNPTYVSQPTQPVRYTTPVQTYTSSGQPIYINNTNTNTNVNTAPVTPVYQTPVTYPTVYVQPAPSCTINVSNYGYNNQATLTWSATDGTSAYISPSLGNVGPSGSLTVYPTNGQIYTMTITGPGGTNTCSTSAYYNNYYQPAPTPVYQNTSCNITASQSSIANGASTVLSWNSYGATSATLSDGLGNVAPNGSLSVMPESTRTYVLTVYGYNGQRSSCDTTVTVNGSYVSLTQIPYTGFDFGATGNAIYWAGLIIFAMAGAYLVIYYRGGAAVFASQIMGSTRQASARQNSVPQPKIAFAAPVARASYAPAAPIKREVVRTERVAPVAPIAPKTMNDHKATTDSMIVEASKGGDMPRIVIARA